MEEREGEGEGEEGERGGEREGEAMSDEESGTLLLSEIATIMEEEKEEEEGAVEREGEGDTNVEVSCGDTVVMTTVVVVVGRRDVSTVVVAMVAEDSGRGELTTVDSTKLGEGEKAMTVLLDSVKL